jgi:hypothetical protein
MERGRIASRRRSGRRRLASVNSQCIAGFADPATGFRWLAMMRTHATVLPRAAGTQAVLVTL